MTMTRSILRLCTLLCLMLALGWPTALVAQPQPECRLQAGSDQPATTKDDIANCVVEKLGPSRIKLTVAYTFASQPGSRNVFLGADVLAGGNRLKWFSLRPVAVTRSTGTLSLEINYGTNDPPKQVTTDQVEFYMYVGGGQIFFRKMFALKNDWQR
jgi:hypothetical protein